MEITQLKPGLSVCAQITAADMAEITSRGFRAIICNRPDGEEADQPDYAEIETAAKSAGLPARYIPVTGGMISEADVDAFADALAELPQPVLAFCRSGKRSETLSAMLDARNGAVDA